MSNLSVEDIHKIREEHAALTRNMNFAEYKTELYQDIKPLLDMLKLMKSKQTYASCPTGAEPCIVAEPLEEYKTKK